MFKPQILRRSFSVFSRVPRAQIVRSAVRDGHETVQIQRVRFKKPFFTRSRFLSAAIATVSIYTAFQWLDDFDEEEVEKDEEERKARQALRRKWSEGQPRLADGDRERKDRNQDEGAAEEEDFEDDEDEHEHEEEDVEPLFFLPTGLSRKKPRTYYRGSDPEWQEFVQIAPNKERVQRIQMELVGLVRQASATRPDYQRRLGNIDTQRGYWWIELKFPDGPPLEYERPGIEITEDLRYRWTTRPVDMVHHQRLNNVLVPTAAAKSMYVDTKKKMEKSWLDFKSYVGWGVAKPESTTTFNGLPLSPPPAPGRATPGQASASPSPSSPLADPSSSKGTTSETPTPSSGPPQKEPATSSLESSVYKRLGVLLPNPQTLTLDMSTFRRAFSRNQKPLFMEPPRGTFIVHGLVEVIGERAKLTLDVTAIYDPKVAQFTMFVSKLRSITDYRQEPKGGP